MILITAGLMGGLLLSRLFFLPYTVNGNSMLPNFKPGNKIILMKHTDHDCGDIVLIENPVDRNKVLLKRIIAIPGNTVEINNRIFYKNGIKIKFNWQTLEKDKRNLPMNFCSRDNMPAVKLKKNEYFLLGDNLDSGFDSRSFGPVNKSQIIGKMIYLF